ncbi:MAG: short chain dehydrogenase [Gammaproteobacteria bacterium]|nr:short chain dehydrogenase [Gammaproteobacteria bacterium]
MKIIIVGGTGTVGKAVTQALSSHDIITVGHQHGDIQADITDVQSIEKMYQSVGAFDALVSATGSVPFAPLTELTLADYNKGLQDKLMGQISLVLMGMKYINEAGSFTLTSGILNYDPIRQGSVASMVNGGIEGFVRSAAIELPKNIRINAVSPTVLMESMDKFGPYFSGFEPVLASRVALAYLKSVDGAQTGQIYRVWK